jgi:uncharacterized protein (TIGR00369 family)
MTRQTSGDGHEVHQMMMPRNTCFGCGKDNPEGMHLKFRFEGKQAVCDFTLPKRFQGPPGHSHGGIVATILDEAMGKVNKLRNVIALTKSMEISYMKPTPLGQTLTAVGWESAVRGRKHYNKAEIRNAAGEVLAKGKGVFIVVDAAKMFAKFARED